MSTRAGILFVTGTLEVGGSETKVVKIANALAESGCSAAIAYLNPPETLLDRVSSEVPVYPLQRRGKFSFSSLQRLNKLVAGPYRTIVSVNFYPLLYVVPAVKALTRGQGSAVCLINTTDFNRGQQFWGRVYAPFLRRCDRLVFGCQAQLNMWTKKYKLSMNRSTYIYNGVDTGNFSLESFPRGGIEFRATFGIPEQATVIGSVGRFAPEKNFDLLIDALGNLRTKGRNAHLILVGAGGEKKALEAAAASNGVEDKVVFAGELRDIRPALAAMDIFVLPSRAVETFSNAALEAMSMERPVVLSDIGGAAEMIEPGKSGYLFEVGNAAMLADRLTDLYDSEPARHQVGLAARKRVIEHFDFAAMLDRYKALIDSPTLED